MTKPEEFHAQYTYHRFPEEVPELEIMDPYTQYVLANQQEKTCEIDLDYYQTVVDNVKSRDCLIQELQDLINEIKQANGGQNNDKGE